MVEPAGQRAKAESGPQRLEVESRETPTTATLEDVSPQISGAPTALMVG